jgi:hypothetical protein
MTQPLTRPYSLSILGARKESDMSDTKIGDDSRLADWDRTLPEPPDHDADVDSSDQPEPEEVPDAVLDE